MSNAELLSVAREHNLSGLIESCVKSLVTRPDKLTVDEVRGLGAESVAFISGLREEARTRDKCLHRCIACDSKPGMSRQNVDVGFVERQVKEWMECDKRGL